MPIENVNQFSEIEFGNGLFFDEIPIEGTYGSAVKRILTDPEGRQYAENIEGEREMFVYKPLDSDAISHRLEDVVAVTRIACDVACITFRDGRSIQALARVPSLDHLFQNEFPNDGAISTARKVLPLAVGTDRFAFYNDLTGRVVIDHRIFDPSLKLPSLQPLTENDLTSLQIILEEKSPQFMENRRMLRISRDNLLHVVNLFAMENRYNPFLDQFSFITWDGVPRVDSLLSNCGGDAPEDYLRWVSKAIMLGVIQRQFEPTTIQCVPVLIGETGFGKSSLLVRLGLDHHKGTTVSARDPRAFHESVKGAVIAELDECSQFRGRDSNHFKSLINQASLTYREPYARISEDHPIRFMMIGTTNHPEVLEDLTSGRRYYPVNMSKENATYRDIWDDISEDEINQMWAEALHRYRNGERWSDGMNDIQDVAEEIRATSTREAFGSDEIQTILEDSDEMQELGKITTETVRSALHTRFGFSTHDQARAITEFNMICNRGKTPYRYGNIWLYGRCRKGYSRTTEGEP